MSIKTTAMDNSPKNLNDGWGTYLRLVGEVHLCGDTFQHNRAAAANRVTTEPVSVSNKSSTFGPKPMCPPEENAREDRQGNGLAPVCANAAG